MANIGPFSPNIIALLLQYGADPNSGGRKIGESSVQDESDEGESDDDSSTEEEEGEEKGTAEQEDEAKECLMAGKNEGSTKVTPLHMLCSVNIENPDNKEQVGPKLK